MRSTEQTRFTLENTGWYTLLLAAFGLAEPAVRVAAWHKSKPRAREAWHRQGDWKGGGCVVLEGSAKCLSVTLEQEMRPFGPTDGYAMAAKR